MSNVIDEFLVSLGFNVDSKGAKKAELSIENIRKQAVGLTKALVVASAAVTAFATKIAYDLDKAYFSAQRMGSSVEGVKSLGYAFSQIGLSAEDAKGSIQSLNSFIKSYPSAAGYLNKLGVQTHNSNGGLRDTSETLTDLIDKLSKMPFYKAKIYGQMFGIDEKTLLSLTGNISAFKDEYQNMLKITGYDANKAAEQSNRYMTSMRSFSSLLGILKDKIGSNLSSGLISSLEKIKKLILDNFPKIEKVITKALSAIIKASEYLTRLIVRGIDLIKDIIGWYDRLDGSHKKTIQILGAMAAAAWLLSSPLMAIMALLTGILLLYDDYKGWQEGKNSLIDWGEWSGELEMAGKLFDGWLYSVTKTIDGISTIFEYVKAINSFFSDNKDDARMNGTSGLIAKLDGGTTMGDMEIAASSIEDLLPKEYQDMPAWAQKEMYDNAVYQKQRAQIVINQHNNINVSGSSDPNSAASAVSDSMDRTNSRVINNIRTVAQ